MLDSANILTHVLDSVGDSVVITDRSGKILFWNQASERDFGYSADEMIGNTIDIIRVDEEDGSEVGKVWHELETSSILRKLLRRRRKDGSIIWVSLSISIIQAAVDKPNLIIGVSKDVTSDIDTRNRLNVFEAILETMQDGVVITELSCEAPERILFFNSAFSRYSGITVAGKNDTPREVFARLFPEWTEPAPEISSLSYSEVFMPDQSGGLWFNMTVVPVVNERGETSHRMFILRDITLRKEQLTRLDEMNTELRQTNLELDKVIYGVSHDLRAPLNSIIGLSGLMKRERYGAEASIFIDKIEQSANRLKEFITNIIQYSKNNTNVPVQQRVDFGEIFNVSADLHRYTEIGQRIAFQYYNPERIAILSDKDRWQIVFNNLIGNSIKYSRAVPNAYVKVSVIRANKSVVLTVEDNGTGIPKERLPSVFDMFYRADTIRSGSGLGLHIVKQAVQSIGAEIAVESQVNVMTRFIVTVPESKIIHD